MKNVYIKYDPYEMTTEFKINGSSVTENKFSNQWIRRVLSENSLMPLQSWIEPVPSEDWSGLLSYLRSYNDDEFTFEFVGRKTDFDDLKESLEKQNVSKCAKLIFPKEKQQFMMDDLAMKKTIDEVISIMLQEKFARIVEKSNSTSLKEEYRTLKDNIDEVNNKEFRIVFTGTYSTGKSTVINALLGKNILPSSEDTCTSKICHIRHSNDAAYARVELICSNKAFETKKCTNAKDVQEMFEKAGKFGNLERIDVHVDMSKLFPNDLLKQFKIVLIDTPGTGSEEDQAHLQMTQNVLASKDKEMVILVSDKKNRSTGITDILDIFESSAASDRGCYNDRFLFVLNQCDAYIYDNNRKDLNGRNEGIETEVINYKDTIKSLSHGKAERNIANPRVFPLSAGTALAIKMGLLNGEKPTKGTEERRYYKITDGFCENLTESHLNEIYEEKCIDINDIDHNYCLDEYSDISKIEKDKLREKYGNVNDVNNYLLLCSGILSLEKAISDYIERYAFPLKMRKLLKVFESILKEVEEENSAFYDELSEAKNRLTQLNDDKSRKNEDLHDDKLRRDKLENYRKKMEDIKNEINSKKIVSPDFNRYKAESFKLGKPENFFSKNPDGSSVVKVTIEEAENIKNEVTKVVRELENSISDDVKNIIRKEDDIYNEYFSKFKRYLQELEADGLLKVGSFDVKKTVGYHKIISDDDFGNYDNYEEQIDNPNKNHIVTNAGIGGFFKSVGKSISTVFVRSKITGINASAYMEEIITCIDGKFSDYIKQVKGAYESDVKNMRDKITSKMDEVLKLVDKSNAEYKRRSNEIQDILRNENEYNDKKKELEESTSFLRKLISELNTIERG